MVDSSRMEKAILKTLAYADIFEYPIKVWEIHKWLISKKRSLKQVEKALKDKSQESTRPSIGSRVKSIGDYYFLKGREELVRKRRKREEISKRYYPSAKFGAFLFKLIPWVKLVGISGSLSLRNSQKKDDIDFFIITQKGRLWITRIFLLGIATIIRKRRKKRENLKKVSGKYCINILLEEDNLAQSDKNIYLAHEILQMEVLYQKENIYQKYLEENSWAFKYLPNWISTESIKYQVSSVKQKKHTTYYIILTTILDFLENLAKNFQLKHMGRPLGQESISENALYFLPVNKQTEVLREYKKRLKRLKLV